MMLDFQGSVSHNSTVARATPEFRRHKVKKIDMAVAAYIALRDEIARINKEAKTKVESLKQKQEIVEQYITAEADTLGVESFRTEHGTAFFQTTTQAAVGDWDTFFEFVEDSGNTQLLKRAASKTAVDEYVRETGSVPPGISYDQVRVLRVRK
jgi:hypothetical protein